MAIQYRGQNFTTFVSTANPNLDGSGSITQLLVGDSSYGYGTVIDQIVVKGIKSVKDGMLRFFIAPSVGSTYEILLEVNVENTVQSGLSPTYMAVIPFAGITLPPNAALGISSETGDSFAVSAFGLDITGYI